MTWTHYFDEDVATEYGTSCAIVIASMQQWIRKNRANGKHLHPCTLSDGTIEDRTWTYNTVKAWTDLFPFWTPKQVRLILEKLIEKKVLKTDNFNRVGFDRTLWYAFEDEKRWLGFDQKGNSDLPEKTNPFDQKGEPIPSSLPSSLPPQDNEAPSREPARSLPKVDFNFTTLKWDNITDEQVKLWEIAFPAVDINSELAKMASWLLANPKKRKTPNGYQRFVVSWLGRSQDRGGSLRAS